jgi:molecular chaperone GrpE
VEAEPGQVEAEEVNSAEAASGKQAEVSAEAVEEDLEVALSLTRSERDEYLEMLRRLQADFENYKKRMVRQQTELLDSAAQGLVVRLLPVLDAFDLGRVHLGDGTDLSAEGKALMQASALLFDTLTKEGLERVDDTGAPFDPTVHEAVAHEAVAHEETDHEALEVPGGSSAQGEAGEATVEGVAEADGPVVVAVLRAGYRWKGRVIRPAMVRVRG